MHVLRPLSPNDFELLVRDLLQEEFGVSLENCGFGRESCVNYCFAHEAQATWRNCFAA